MYVCVYTKELCDRLCIQLVRIAGHDKNVRADITRLCDPVETARHNEALKLISHVLKRVCVCVCLCVCVCVCIYMCVCVYMCVCFCMYVCVCV